MLNPNQTNNSVIFSIMEAKDHSTNLLLCVERYKSHIKQFRYVKWERKTFRSCLFIWRLGMFMLCMGYLAPVDIAFKSSYIQKWEKNIKKCSHVYSGSDY